MKDSAESFTLNLERATPGGAALGFQNGLPIFVPLGVPGDQITAQWHKKKKTYGLARIKTILKPSPHRTAAPCPLFPPASGNEGCGGCQWQMMDYPFQLQSKKSILEDSLRRIAKLDPQKLPLENVLGMENPWNYRNKVQYPLQRGEQGRLLLGYYERQSHRIVDLESCPVELNIFEEILPRLKAALASPDISIYNEHRHQGLLRYVCLRGSQRTQEFLIILVSTKNIPRSVKDKILSLNLPHLTGLVENINPIKGNIIYGEESRALWGRPYYHEKILDKTFRISATSFFQTNTAAAEKIVEDVLRHWPGQRLAVDAFCGTGVFTLFLADRAEKVIGIEEVSSSLQDAGINQSLNHAKNIEWRQGRVEEMLPALEEQPGLILVDPPREGLKPEALSALLKIRPPHLIYLSCDPATLARDLAGLVAGGYRITRIQPFDLFPHTYHLETLVYLTHG